MDIILIGPSCIAVSQGTMYALVSGFHSGGDGGVLLVLMKSEYPTTTVANNTWSVISTSPPPAGFFDPYDFVVISNVGCSVDKNGVFTYRNLQGTVGYRYDPRVPKLSKTRTCSSDANGLGEWKRLVLVNPVEFKYRIPLIIQPEIESPGRNSGGYNEEDEMAIYDLGWSDQAPTAIRYARINKDLFINKITISDISQFSLVSICFRSNTRYKDQFI